MNFNKFPGLKKKKKIKKKRKLSKTEKKEKKERRKLLECSQNQFKMDQIPPVIWAVPLKNAPIPPMRVLSITN